MGAALQKAVLPLAAIGAATAAFGVAAVKTASDVAESQNKVNVVFGEGAEAINAFAKTSAASLGISRGAALDAAGTFGNMFGQLGISSDVTAEMSKSMITLAADLGSFHNADISEVIAAQTSAFRGEYDAVQRFVPTINAAAVEQKALAMTGKAATKELTLQEKALATHALLMAGAGAATGDFANTSTGMANSMKIIQAQFANITVAIGEKLLPVLAPLIADFAKSLPGALEDLVPKIEAVFGAIGTLAEGFGKLIELGSSIVKFFQDNQLALDALTAVLAGAAIVAVVAMTPALVAMGIAAGGAAIAVALAAAPFVAIALVIGAAILAGKLIIENWDAIVAAAGNLASQVGAFFDELGTKITSSLNVFLNIGQQIVSGLWSGISGSWNDLMSNVMGLINRLPEGVRKFLGISSPSTVFMEIGEEIAAGLAAGIVDAGDQVQQALAKLVAPEQLDQALRQIISDEGVNAAINHMLRIGATAEDAITSVQRVHKDITDEMRAVAEEAARLVEQTAKAIAGKWADATTAMNETSANAAVRGWMDNLANEGVASQLRVAARDAAMGSTWEDTGQIMSGIASEQSQWRARLQHARSGLNRRGQIGSGLLERLEEMVNAPGSFGRDAQRYLDQHHANQRPPSTAQHPVIIQLVDASGRLLAELTGQQQKGRAASMGRVPF